jgi:hypothetical protein
VHTPGSTLPVTIHIAHKRPETVTVPWALSLIDPWGRVVAERVTPPQTFEPGDVVDVKLALPLPEDLEGGTYTLRLGITEVWPGSKRPRRPSRWCGPSKRPQEPVGGAGRVNGRKPRAASITGDIAESR